MLLLLLLSSWETVYLGDGFQFIKVWFSAMADYIKAKSRALNRAVKCCLSFKTELYENL